MRQRFINHQTIIIILSKTIISILQNLMNEIKFCTETSVLNYQDLIDYKEPYNLHVLSLSII